MSLRFVNKQGKLVLVDIHDLILPNKDFNLAVEIDEMEAMVPADYEIDQKFEKPFAQVEGVKVVDIEGNSRKGIELSPAQDECYTDFALAGELLDALRSDAKAQNGVLYQLWDSMGGGDKEWVGPRPLLGSFRGFGHILSFPYTFYETGGVPELERMHILNQLVSWHFNEMRNDLKAAAVGVPNSERRLTTWPHESEMLKNPARYKDTALPDSWLLCIFNYSLAKRYINQLLTFLSVKSLLGTPYKIEEFKFDETNMWDPNPKPQQMRKSGR